MINIKGKSSFIDKLVVIQKTTNQPTDRPTNQPTNQQCYVAENLHS